jgi:hypothetical protein
MSKPSQTTLSGEISEEQMAAIVQRMVAAANATRSESREGPALRAPWVEDAEVDD